MFRIFNLALLVLLIGTFVISCSKDKDTPSEPLSDEAESFTVKYDLVGDPGGTLVVYSQDLGKCILEVRNDRKTMSVIEDDEYYVISIDTTTNKGTKMLNPIYKSMVESLGSKTPKEFTLAVFEQMGGKITGEKTIAGNKCDVWELQEGAQKTCMTKDGIILETESNIGEIKKGKIATEVIRGSTEGVDVCSTGDAEIEEVDISQMLQQQGVEAPKFELKTEEATEEDSAEEKRADKEPQSAENAETTPEKTEESSDDNSNSDQED